MLTKLCHFAVLRRTLCISLVSCLAFTSGSAIAAKIYKTVDKDGNVAYTDVAPKDKSTAIEVSVGNDYTPPTTDDAVAAPRQEESVEENGRTRYTGIAIVSPGNDAAVRETRATYRLHSKVEPSYDSCIRPRCTTDHGRQSGRNRALHELHPVEHRSRDPCSYSTTRR